MRSGSGEICQPAYAPVWPERQYRCAVGLDAALDRFWEAADAGGLGVDAIEVAAAIPLA